MTSATLGELLRDVYSVEHVVLWPSAQRHVHCSQEQCSFGLPVKDAASGAALLQPFMPAARELLDGAIAEDGARQRAAEHATQEPEPASAASSGARQKAGEPGPPSAEADSAPGKKRAAEQQTSSRKKAHTAPQTVRPTPWLLCECIVSSLSTQRNSACCRGGKPVVL